MTDTTIPAAVRDRLLSSARRLLMAAERPKSPDRCDRCLSHSRGVMDGAPTFLAIDGYDPDNDLLALCIVPATCFDCGARSNIQVMGSFLYGEAISAPNINRPGEAWAPDPDDPLMVRSWPPGRVHAAALP